MRLYVVYIFFIIIIQNYNIVKFMPELLSNVYRTGTLILTPTRGLTEAWAYYDRQVHNE
jgi:hypothetical protein